MEAETAAEAGDLEDVRAEEEAQALERVSASPVVSDRHGPAREGPVKPLPNNPLLSLPLPLQRDLRARAAPEPASIDEDLEQPLRRQRLCRKGPPVVESSQARGHMLRRTGTVVWCSRCLCFMQNRAKRHGHACVSLPKDKRRTGWAATRLKRPRKG